MAVPHTQVKLKFPNPEKSLKRSKVDTLLYWPASHIPVEAKFSLETSSKTNKTTVHAESHINFHSNDTGEGDVDYYIATRDSNDRLVCQSTRLFRMFPNYDLKQDTCEQTEDTNRLTKREQLDELKEKFGSRKSQRELASKRKYEIQFGEDDIDNLPTIKQRLDDSEEANNNVDESVDLEQKILSAILPPRNASANVVSEVYSLRDIITEPEEATIKEYEETLLSAIKSDFIRSFISEANSQTQLMAIYADLLLQLAKLSAYEMRKADPLPTVEAEVKKHLFERYTSTKQCSSRSLRYVITDQNKDRIYVYIFLLVFMLNNYKPIELDKLQTNCKLPMNNIRRMLELIGCYIENMRNSAGITVKVARFKLPLNVYKESKRKFRR